MTLRLYLTRLFLATVVCVMALTAAFAQSVVDDLGREVALAAPPTAVVSLLPSHTETLCAIDACGLIVGIDRHSGVEGIQELPRLGDPYAPDLEAIVALEPDLVLVDEYSGLHQALQDLGLTVYAGSPQTVGETYAYFATIGTLVDRTDEAEALVAKAREDKIVNEWTKRAIDELNKYKPQDYPLYKEERQASEERSLSGMPLLDGDALQKMSQPAPTTQEGGS